MIELQIQRLRPGAVVPARAYAGDAGLDLSACERLELGPGERAVAGTGLAAKHGITVVNSPGLIDAGYRGEVKVIMLNTDKRKPFVVEAGMRIAQLVLVEAAGVRLVELDELSLSERGAAGLGSSG